MILLLTLIQLIDNFKFQIASFILLQYCVLWLAACVQVDFHTFPIHVIRSNRSNDVGFVLSNLRFRECRQESWLTFDHSWSLPSLQGSNQSTFASSFGIPYLLLGWEQPHDGQNCYDLEYYFHPETAPILSPSFRLSYFPRFVFRDIRNLRWFYYTGSCSRLAIAVRYNLLRGEIFFLTRTTFFLSAVLLIGIPNKSKCLRYQNNWNWVVV